MDQHTLRDLSDELTAFLAEFDDCFSRENTRKHLRTYVQGQLSALERKSVEPMALEAGTPPRTLQQFLGLHRWDEAGMRRRVRAIVSRDHADANAIGAIDETSYAKKGSKTVGVQRQYCGTTGKVDNCLQSVHLSFINRDFSTIVDSDLFLPESWCSDPERRAEAGVPKNLLFRTKWEIALDLVDRSRRDGLGLRWIIADEFYGRASAFLEGLQSRGLLYVVEIPVVTWGWTPRAFERGREHRRIDDLFRRGGPSWETYKIKETTKGPHVWRARATRFVCHAGRDRAAKWLVVAENVLTNETKYFLSNAPEDTTIATLLTVAFSRWSIERNFEDSKQEVGLDHFEVRTYLAVQRHLAVSMASLLFLARATARLKKT